MVPILDGPATPLSWYDAPVHRSLWILAALLASCEPRIEEPVPPPSTRAPTAPAPSALLTGQTTPPSSAHAATGPSTDPTDAGRCIFPTPPTAQRALKPGPDPKCPKDPEKRPTLRSGKVVFVDAKAQAVEVEVVENDHDRQRGLMYRTSMPEDHGMIFRMEDRRVHAFWMHNTCIPLDMLFIDDDGTIVGIEENAPTLDDSTFQVGCPSTHVLELNAGWTRSHGVTAGQKVRLERVDP